MILENIKTRTYQNHKALEQSNLLSAIASGALTRELYISILKKFYGFFHPLEQSIHSYGEIIAYLPDFHERRKSERLLKDLKAMNVQETPVVCADLPAISSIAQVFGCLYVMEGSTLGGRMISRILHEKLGIDETSGASFFNGYGQDTGIRWKAFQQALVQLHRQTGEEESIIQTADGTFDRFHKWMTLH